VENVAPLSIESDARFVEASRAMADEMWTIASPKWEALSQDRRLSQADRLSVSLLWAQCLIRGGDSTKALEILRPLSTSEAVYWQGEALLQLGNLAAAEAKFAAVPASSPEFDYARWRRANLLISLGDIEAALPLLEAISRESAKVFQGRAALRLAEWFLEQNQPDRAATHANSAATIFPSSETPPGPLLWIQARIAINQANWELAGALVKQLENPALPTFFQEGALFLKAKIEMKTGDPAQAARQLVTMVEGQTDRSWLPAILDLLSSVPPDSQRLAGDRLAAWSVSAEKPLAPSPSSTWPSTK
jgi:tetratricopeptide (TPR) repeat protein